MFKQYLVFDKPIPSCDLYRLIWDENKKDWKYEFEVLIQSDKELDNSEGQKFYVYGHVLSLMLVKDVTKNSINIEINSYDEYYDLLLKQQEQDEMYRNDWIAKNPDYYENILTVELENKTQVPDYYHIVSILERKENSTVFIVSPRRRSKN